MRYPFSYVYPVYMPYYTPWIPKDYIEFNYIYRYLPPQMNTPKVKTNEIKYDNQYIKADLRYPELEGLQNKQIQNFINNSIKNDIIEFKKQMEEAAKTSEMEARMSGEEFEPFIISTIYQVTYNKNNIISISIIYDEFLNGENSYIQTSYNFNLQNGKSMSLKDLFKEGVNYQEVINKEIRKELTLNKEQYFPGALENFKGIAKYHPFYIENGDIAVYFGLHEIAPTSSGIPVIKIPFSSLKNYVKPIFSS